ncbi:MAG: STELLO glycosyltransferase family protein, partial [Planctomycetota bacterium]
ADDNPDVDAVYRLTQRLPLTFRKDRRLALGNGSKCPFNSQNTTWFPDAYPLLYLPAYCSFRMTDIWRSDTFITLK